MSLSGRQFKELQDALLSAFHSRADLEQMVKFGLDENLNHIAGGENLSTLVFNLIGWAEARGRIEELVGGARAHNSGNSALRAFAISQFGEADSDTDSAAEPKSGDDQASKNGTRGDQTSVGNISNAAGVAVGSGNQVNVTHNYHYYNSPSRPVSQSGQQNVDDDETTDAK